MCVVRRLGQRTEVCSCTEDSTSCLVLLRNHLSILQFANASFQGLAWQHTLVWLPRRANTRCAFAAPSEATQVSRGDNAYSKTAVIVNGDEYDCLFLRGESTPHSRSVTVLFLYNTKKGVMCVAV